MVGGRRFRPSVAVVDGRRFRPTSGHLEFTSMSIVSGTATIWQPSELSVEERNLLSSASQSFSVSSERVFMVLPRESLVFVLQDS